MPDIIHLLPDSIANQIAAGEVVQRPSSVVKELMENSIDAGATKVQVIVRDAGKQLIQVIDNGKGMSETDARMSLERHATSKITKAEDLFTLRTMGFRGEALASIAAVSQLEMKTRQSTSELGTALYVEASEVKRQEVEACQAGTTIIVKNLFYNIPARRNFLKGNPVELKHIIDEFTHVALAYPTVAFSLINGDELSFDLPASKLSQRIVGLFGKSYQQQLMVCREETNDLRVTGYVGRPDLAKKTRSEQFIFVNNRYIRNNYLHHAVMNGFEGLLTENSFPFYALFIDIDPKYIDVNVHPTKTEIKFVDDRSIYTVVRVAVKHALGTHHLSPAIDFAENINLVQKLSEHSQQAHQDVIIEQTGESFQKNNLENWKKLFEDSAFQQGGDNLKSSSNYELKLGSLMNRDSYKAAPSEKALFQFQNKFIIREVNGGLMIINQQAAHERVLFDRFIQQLKNSSSASQQLLFPLVIDFTLADFTLLMEMKVELAALGFRFEVFGKQTLLFNGVPAEANSREKEVVEGLIEQFKKNKSELQLPVGENLARSLAKRTAIKTGQKLTKEHQEALVSGLFSSANPAFTPDGKTTFFIFETTKMESHFS